MNRILLTAAALLVASPAIAAPQHCERDAQTWWAKYVALGRVDPAKSAASQGVAYVTWRNGLEQVLTLGEVDGRGYCAVAKRALQASAEAQ